MAAANNEQPAFDVVAQAMNDVSRSHATLATHFERIPNIPGFDGGTQILAEIRALRTDMGVHFVDMGIPLEDVRPEVQEGLVDMGIQLEDVRLEIQQGLEAL